MGVLINYMNQVLQGDCLELMKQIPDKSIDMNDIFTQEIEQHRRLQEWYRTPKDYLGQALVVMVVIVVAVAVGIIRGIYF
jgi:hypothetical protein